MSIIQNKFPAVYRAYMLVAEPRIVRIILFVIYLLFLLAGILVVSAPPDSFQEILSRRLVLMFGGFLTLGGVLSSVAVLPGIWWLERCGLIALATGMLMYIILVIGVKGSPVGLCVSIAFVLFFILRYMETRQFKLAPRRE